MNSRALSLLLLASLVLTSCINVGSRTIARDRFNYNVAIRDSWEEQILINVVSLRYGEAPVFLDIESVIAQYSLETSGGVAAGLNASLSGDDTVVAEGRAVWTERPTITYAPVKGREFTVNMLTPLRPAEIFAMIEAGWNAERSLRLLLKSINGLSSYDPETQQLNQEFFDVLHAFKVLQDQQALGIRREIDGDDVRTFIYLRDVVIDPEIDRAAATIEKSLRLQAGHDEYELVFGHVADRPDQIALQTMSILDILVDTAAYIQAPDIHVNENRTRPNRVFDAGNERLRPPVRIYSSTEKPEGALVSVESRGYWFYVDDRDIDSKKSLAFLMVLLQLSASYTESQGPAVTIGAGG